MRSPTPASRRLDSQGRPYFLWDTDLTEEAFRAMLRDPDRALRTAMIGKLMRQAKPDDVFEYVTEAEVRGLWPEVLPYLGQTRAMWEWLFEAWSALDAR